MDSEQNKERPNQKLKVQGRCNGQANHHICHPETPFVVWPCDEKRRNERCKASNNDEGGRKETSWKAQTEVDGPSAERFETTPGRPKARTEPRNMEESSHGDRPRTGIRSTKVSKCEQNVPAADEPARHRLSRLTDWWPLIVFILWTPRARRRG